MPSLCFLGQVLEPLGTVTFSHRSHCPGLGARVPHFRGGCLSGCAELPWVLLPLPLPRILAGVHAVCSPRLDSSVILLPPHESCVCCSPLVCLRSAHTFLKYLPFTLSASDSLSVYEAILWQPPLTFFSLTQQSTNWINSVSSIIYLFSFCLLVLWFCAFIIFFFTFLRPQDFKWTNYILSYLLWFKIVA